MGRNRRFSGLGIVLGVMLLSGCVRYIPSRNDINNEMGGPDPAIMRVGDDAFHEFEKIQKAKLDALINDRLQMARHGENQRYRIGPGDTLDIKVEKFDEISKTVEVEPSGTMTLPQLGAMRVAGQTREDIIQAIAAQITDYLVDPQVEVTVTKSRGNKVWLMGEVAKPGSYPLEQPYYSLLEFLADTGNIHALQTDSIFLFPAGQSTSWADALGTSNLPMPVADCPTEGLMTWISDMSAVSLEGRTRRRFCSRRGRSLTVPEPNPVILTSLENAPADSRIEIDVEQLFGDKDKPPLYIPLVSGDKIYIPKKMNVQVHGEVNQRGTVELNTRGFLMSAILEAGGLTYSADVHNIEIYREIGGGKKAVMAVDLEENVIRNAQDVRLRDGDIVSVPSAGGRYVRANIFNWLDTLLGTSVRYQTNQGRR